MGDLSLAERFGICLAHRAEGDRVIDHVAEVGMGFAPFRDDFFCGRAGNRFREEHNFTLALSGRIQRLDHLPVDFFPRGRLAMQKRSVKPRVIIQGEHCRLPRGAGSTTK